jgi:hypothetical protein
MPVTFSWRWLTSAIASGLIVTADPNDGREAERHAHELGDVLLENRWFVVVALRREGRGSSFESTG